MKPSSDGRQFRVLIPSDNRDFVNELATAYRTAGCDVATGALNFELRSASFDLVHFQWPEEYCGWVPPTDGRLTEIVDCLKWWQERCETIVSVHNLWPHGYVRDSQCQRLYQEFYERCTRMLHFSAFSKTRVFGEFPAARHDRHLVTSLWNFEQTVANQKSRGSRRAELGIHDDELVILVFGALRSAAEIELIQNAYRRCRVAKKRLLVAARYNEEPPRKGKKWRKFLWRAWLWRMGAAVDDGFVPDNDLSKYFDSADVVVIPRTAELNSGVPSLAATFGTPIVAPNVGVFAEFLAKTGNELYNPGNSISLAEAIESIAQVDRAELRAANRRLALDQWNWSAIVGPCLGLLRTETKAS